MCPAKLLELTELCCRPNSFKATGYFVITQFGECQMPVLPDLLQGVIKSTTQFPQELEKIE